MMAHPWWSRIWPLSVAYYRGIEANQAVWINEIDRLWPGILTDAEPEPGGSQP